MKYLRNSQNMKPKMYAEGGNMASVDYSSIGFLLQALLEKDRIDKQGFQDVSVEASQGVFKGAGVGASIGSQILPGLGTAIGAVGGGIVGAITGKRNAERFNSKLRTQKRIEEDFVNQNREDIDKSNLSTFSSKGVNSISNFAKGGDLFPVSNKVELAVGDSHEKDTNNDGITGISLSLQGKPVAEIESGEVKWDNKIFSDRIGIGNKTFANIALDLIKTTAYKNAEEMEDKYKETANDVRANIFKRGTARRMLDKNPNPLGVLFEIQETQKAQQAEIEQQTADVPKAAMGMDLANLLGKAGNISAGIVPYLDNIYNAKLTANAPQLPTPTRRVAPTLKTDFDINPQLNEVNRDTQALNDIITDTTASSSIANTNRIANRLQGTYAKNRALSEKQNIETSLINQQSSINAEVTNANAGILDEYRMREFGRQSDLRAERSANVANAVEDARMAKIDSNAAKLDKQRIALTAAQYLDTGVLDRSGFDKVMGIIDNGGSLEEALTFMNNQRKRIEMKVPESLPQRKSTVNSLGKNYRGRNTVEAIMEDLLK